MNVFYECVRLLDTRKTRSKHSRGKEEIEKLLNRRAVGCRMWDTRPDNRSERFGIQVFRFPWLRTRMSSSRSNRFVNCSSSRFTTRSAVQKARVVLRQSRQLVCSSKIRAFKLPYISRRARSTVTATTTVQRSGRLSMCFRV